MNRALHGYIVFQVYKSWVNQTESETGQAAGLPYDVTQVQSFFFPQIINPFGDKGALLRLYSSLLLDTLFSEKKVLLIFFWSPPPPLKISYPVCDDKVQFTILILHGLCINSFPPVSKVPVGTATLSNSEHTEGFTNAYFHSDMPYFNTFL